MKINFQPALNMQKCSVSYIKHTEINPGSTVQLRMQEMGQWLEPLVETHHPDEL